MMFVSHVHTAPDHLSDDVDCIPRLTSLSVEGVDGGEPRIAFTWKVGPQSSDACDGTFYEFQLGTCTAENFDSLCNQTLMNTSHTDVFLHRECPLLSTLPFLATIEIKSELRDQRKSSFLVHDLMDTSK